MKLDRSPSKRQYVNKSVSTHTNPLSFCVDNGLNPSKEEGCTALSVTHVPPPHLVRSQAHSTPQQHLHSYIDLKAFSHINSVSSHAHYSFSGFFPESKWKTLCFMSFIYYQMFFLYILFIFSFPISRGCHYQPWKLAFQETKSVLVIGYFFYQTRCIIY